MPRKHLSVRKRHRQSLVRRARNRSVKSAVRGAVKSVLTATGVDEKKESLKTASSVVDKAAARGVIHKNKAARIKSRLARKVNTAK
ncbi:MAG TPA: 30S ribosomal protein S20 [bacterium]|nr:30S ribosomal protein S20 [bacterium]